MGFSAPPATKVIVAPGSAAHEWGKAPVSGMLLRETGGTDIALD